MVPREHEVVAKKELGPRPELYPRGGAPDVAAQPWGVWMGR